MSSGSSFALVVMAFLAVLKEGFETAVFLLAAAQASRGSGGSGCSAAWQASCAPSASGRHLLRRGRLNLGRFFRITGVFLVLIAAGLVMSRLRTAHEAGWINIGQQRALDLSAWIPTNSIRGAIVRECSASPPIPG